MSKIKIKRIQFNNGTPDFIFSIEEYNHIGYNQIIKDNSLRIAEIKGVKDDLMNKKQFDSLQPWEG